MSDASEKANRESEDNKSTPTAGFSDVGVPGDQVGSYKLLSVLGEGGFAVVYLAEQQGQVKRRVALKVIKPGMDTKQVIARFEAERQALALLKPSNILVAIEGNKAVPKIIDFGVTKALSQPLTER